MKTKFFNKMFYGIMFCLVTFALPLQSEDKTETKDTLKDTTLSVGIPFPAFTAIDIYGNEINIEKLKGKVVIIVTGYTVQPTKEEEKEDVNTCNFYDSTKYKGLEMVSISSKKGIPIGISKSFVEGRAKKYCVEHQEHWQVIIDWNSSLKKLVQMTDKPLVFVIDKSGIIRYKTKGDLIIDNSFEDLIQKLLAE